MVHFSNCARAGFCYPRSCIDRDVIQTEIMKGDFMMKKLGLVLSVILLALGTSPLWAASQVKDELDETPTPAPAANTAPGQSKFSFSIGPSLLIPASSNTAQQYNVGGGAELLIGYSLSDQFMLGLQAWFQDATVNTTFLASTFQKTYGFSLPPNVVLTGDYSYFPVLAVARYTIGQNQKVRPYLFWGMGAAINQASVAVGYQNQSIKITGSETSFLLSPGMGLSLALGDDLEFYFQGGIDIDFTTNSGGDIFTLTATGSQPVLESGNLSDDSPTLFIPIQAGLRFL